MFSSLSEQYVTITKSTRLFIATTHTPTSKHRLHLFRCRVGLEHCSFQDHFLRQICEQCSLRLFKLQVLIFFPDFDDTPPVFDVTESDFYKNRKDDSKEKDHKKDNDIKDCP